MTDRHTVPLADWLQASEIERCITVEEEDSVRADWWRATCSADDWYATGIKQVVGDAAADHIYHQHRACSAPSDRTFVGVPVYCDERPDHGGNLHKAGGYGWPKAEEAKPAPDGPPPLKPLRCPLASCKIVLDDPRPPADWMLLSQALGMDIRILGQMDYLREHLETHTVMDFVTEISRLTKLLEQERGHIHLVTGPATKIIFNPSQADIDEA